MCHLSHILYVVRDTSENGEFPQNTNEVMNNNYALLELEISEIKNSFLEMKHSGGLLDNIQVRFRSLSCLFYYLFKSQRLDKRANFSRAQVSM